jgi:hypothetical protein
LFVMGLSLSTALAAEVSVSPASGLADAPFRVKVHGVAPGSRVTLKLTRPDEQGMSWTAVGEYAADAHGDVDASSDPSLGGSYRGTSPHGLLCSVLPVSPEQLETYLGELPAHPDRKLSFAAPLQSSAIIVTAIVGGQVVGSAAAQRKYADNAGEEVTATGGLRGLYFAAPAYAPSGAPVLIIPGSDGGVYFREAALLASHGHPAFAFATFRYKDLAATLDRAPRRGVGDVLLGGLGRRVRRPRRAG